MQTGKATEFMFSDVVHLFPPGIKINLVTFKPSEVYVNLENTYTVLTGAAQSKKSHISFPPVGYVSVTLIFEYNSITFQDPQYLTGIWHFENQCQFLPVTISVSHQVSTNAVVSLNTMDAHVPGDGECKSFIASSL